MVPEFTEGPPAVFPAARVPLAPAAPTKFRESAVVAAGARGQIATAERERSVRIRFCFIEEFKSLCAPMQYRDA
jgi:hypothetical protein